MTTPFISLSEQHDIAILTLNRPEKRNAMHGEMIQALLARLTHLAHSKCRVLIIKGEGEHFCAGADIAWMQTIANSTPAENQADAAQLAALMHAVYAFPHPTIALVHGATIGGGMGLMTACDMAIAAENTSFGFPEVKMGIAPSVISPYVIQAMGQRAARYYFLTGQRFDAVKAYELGLIQEVVPGDTLMARGMALAESLIHNAPLASTAIKQLIHCVANEGLTAELIKKTAEHIANLRASDEAQEGLKAFLEKRSPNWIATL